jgi:hypothetical protein
VAEIRRSQFDKTWQSLPRTHPPSTSPQDEVANERVELASDRAEFCR